ncbi:MAG: FliM/FliN family flagellar motor C-terminal domain-containing protein [Terriglobales bacterium]|jgi:flagellar motor switch/type III secretory pathway protein FliN
MATPAQREEKEQGPEQATESTRDAAERFPWLPCRLSLEVPVSDFNLGDLLRLRKDSIITTALGSTEDIPLRVNGRLIAWIQFEMIGERLAARITELA